MIPLCIALLAVACGIAGVIVFLAGVVLRLSGGYLDDEGLKSAGALFLLGGVLAFAGALAQILDSIIPILRSVIGSA